jgi:hypothetical protein
MKRNGFAVMEYLRVLLPKLREFLSSSNIGFHCTENFSTSGSVQVFSNSASVGA